MVILLVTMCIRTSTGTLSFRLEIKSGEPSGETIMIGRFMPHKRMTIRPWDYGMGFFYSAMVFVVLSFIPETHL